LGASKEQCLGAAALLFNQGLLKDNKAETLARVNKLLYDFLHGDYIPKATFYCGGKEDMTNVRAAPPGMRCARQIGDDYPQSGPIYCGNPAVLIADSIERPGAYYVVCKRHSGHMPKPHPETTATV